MEADIEVTTFYSRLKKEITVADFVCFGIKNHVSIGVHQGDRKLAISQEFHCFRMMVGNVRLEELGFGEEALGRNTLIAGFQGQRHWTDHFPNGDFMEAMLNSSFDWNGIRQPYLMATENATGVAGGWSQMCLIRMT